MKPRLLNEGGITQTSLKNGKRLAKRLGAPVRVEAHRNSRTGEWYTVIAYYESGDQHTFTGFSWGYGGEGPHGFAKWCEANDIPLTFDEIMKLDNTTDGCVWAWPTEAA